MSDSFKNYIVNSVTMLTLSTLTFLAPRALAQTSEEADIYKKLRSLPTRQTERSDPRQISNIFALPDEPIDPVKLKAQMDLDSMINAQDDDCMIWLFKQPDQHLPKITPDYRDNFKNQSPFKLPSSVNGGPKGW